MTQESDTPPKALNPSALKRLELISLITQAGTPISNATVGNWIAAGCPRNQDGTLSLIHVCAWLAGDRRRKEEAKPSTPSATEQLAQFRLDQARGEVIPRAEVLALYEEAGDRLRSVLESVERQHGPAVGETIREAIIAAFSKIEEIAHGGDKSMA